MNAHPTLTLIALVWVTSTAVASSAYGIYRSLGGKAPPFLCAPMGETVGSRILCLTIDALSIVATYTVLSLAWSAR